MINLSQMNIQELFIYIWAILVAIFILYYAGKQEVEGFYTYYGYYKKYCPSCGWRSRYSCSKCVNCGYCITANGLGECVPGDSSGPYFREDCMYWEYGDPYGSPFSNIHPTVTVRNVYPYYRWHLRRPYRSYKKNRRHIKKN